MIDDGPWRWRALTEDDQADVLAAVRTWWGEDGGGDARAALLPRLFFQHFGPTSCTVRDDADRLVAFLVGFVSQTDPTVGYVHFLGVSPDVRGDGLGRALHDRFAAAVREAGCTSVQAITSVGNTRSQEFHRRLGFTVSDPVEDHDGAGGARVCFTRSSADHEGGRTSSTVASRRDGRPPRETSGHPTSNDVQALTGSADVGGEH